MVLRRQIFVPLLLLTVVAWSCAGQLTSQGRQLLQNGYTASAAGDNKAVISATDSFLRDWPRGDHSDEAYYLRGLAKYNMGNRDGAQADLAEALNRAKSKEVRAKASLALGDLAWDREDIPSAEGFYLKATDNLNRGERPVDHAYYRLGCVLQRLGRWEEADRQFSLLVEQFSGSELAALGGRRMHARDWTIQAGAFERKSRAEAVAKELQSRGQTASIQPVASDKRMVFVVQAGHYPTYEQAMEVLPGVKAIKSEAFVITTR